MLHLLCCGEAMLLLVPSNTVSSYGRSCLAASLTQRGAGGLGCWVKGGEAQLCLPWHFVAGNGRAAVRGGCSSGVGGEWMGAAATGCHRYCKGGWVLKAEQMGVCTCASRAGTISSWARSQHHHLHITNCGLSPCAHAAAFQCLLQPLIP